MITEDSYGQTDRQKGKRIRSALSLWLTIYLIYESPFTHQSVIIIIFNISESSIQGFLAKKPHHVRHEPVRRQKVARSDVPGLLSRPFLAFLAILAILIL